MDGIGNRLLVVFDGHCGLCNGWVRWLLRRDRLDRLRFATSASPVVKQLLERHIELLESNGNLATVFVARNPLQADEQLWVRFKGILVVLRELPHPWPAVALVLGWIPDCMSDPIYRLNARWRYRIWGRMEKCALPAPKDRTRFL